MKQLFKLLAMAMTSFIFLVICFVVYVFTIIGVISISQKYLMGQTCYQDIYGEQEQL